MDRGIKDEGFVRKALEIAQNADGKWIANQTHFNGLSDSNLEPVVHAALVTAVAIYVQKNKLEEAEIKTALAATTVGAAKKLIDRLSELVRKG
ncbi:MAG: hypothetical protein Q9M28_00005 [Mariprofundaceae bacterium]|nr:hypothetical protein [Mariprofundaceae bacterium]